MTKSLSRSVPPCVDDVESFNKEVEANIKNLGKTEALKKAGSDFLLQSVKAKYSYNFSWMGLPIMQFPQDMAAMQEVIWKTKPDTIIETGVARGGSLIFYAGLMEMMGLQGGKVIGIDIDVRAHNRRAIEQHPLSKRITLIEGSSTDRDTVQRVKACVTPGSKTIVCLDSMHTHAHVLEELRLYSPFVTAGSYLVVFDTVVEELPKDLFLDRPWGPGDNPYTAVQSFLKESKDFENDQSITDKLVITCCRGGYLKKRDTAANQLTPVS